MVSARQSSQTAEQPFPRGPEPAERRDPATTVVYTLRRLGIAGLPRNYELFYEAITAGNRELSQTLSALGSRPEQKDLDAIGRKFLARSDAWEVAAARDNIAQKLNEILSLLRKERQSMETYGKILGETATGLGSRPPLSREFLDRIVSVTAAATRTSIASRSQIVSTISDRSSELQEMKATLEEYKRQAETDPLTLLLNRRAFDRSLMALYDPARGTAQGALLLADIDRFKTINDRFGHPVGDRVIQIVAGVIQTKMKEGIVAARTGGEEFAIISEMASEDAANRLAEEIRQAVMDTSFVNINSGVNYGPVTISLGLCMAAQARGPDDLYTKTDRALYASKAGGRNRVTRYAQMEDGGFLKNWLLYRKD